MPRDRVPAAPRVTGGTVTVLIRRSADDVFAVVSDVELNSRWSSASIEGHLLTPGPVRVGTQAREVSRVMQRRIVVMSQIVEFVPGRRLAYHTTGGPFPFDGSFEVEPVGDATRLTATFAVPLTGAARAAGPFLRMIARRQLARDLDRLRSLLESGGAGAAVGGADERRSRPPLADVEALLVGEGSTRLMVASESPVQTGACSDRNVRGAVAAGRGLAVDRDRRD